MRIRAAFVQTVLRLNFVLLAAAATVTWTGAASSTCPGTTAPDFVLKWGTMGSGNGQFNKCDDVTCDANGTVYVTDRVNNRIQMFDCSGVYAGSWGMAGTGNGQFMSPSCVAVDNLGHVFVGDQGNHRIQRFSASGVFQMAWGSSGTGNGQFNEPKGIATDASGNVYVADNLNYRIQVFTNDGVFIRKWGSLGTGNGQFNAADDLDIGPGGQVYVADTYNHRIQEFDVNGNFVGKFGTMGTGNSQFNLATGVTADGDGNLYVSDYINRRIQKFSPAYGYLTQWGTSGSGNGQFNGAYSIESDPDGVIYVADTDNHRVQKFGCNIPVGCPNTWTGGAGDGSWHTAGNWSLNRVPATGDDVDIPDLAGTASVTYSTGSTSINSLSCSETLILSGGTLTTALPSFSSKSLTLSGATLAGTGTFDITGAFAWTAGTMSGAGTTKVGAIAWSLSPSSSCTLLRTLENSGTGTQSGTGNLVVTSPGSILNRASGVYIFTSSGDITGTGSFMNESDAVVHKVSGFLTSVDCQFTNLGTVRVNSGFNVNLSLPNLTNFSGGTLTGGTYDLGSFLFLTGDFVTNAATVLLSGNGRIAGGLAKFKVNSAQGHLSITGGSETLDSLVINSGVFELVGVIATMTSGYRQISGETHLGGGQLTCPLLEIQDGLLDGRTTIIDGNVVNDGTLTIQPAAQTFLGLRIVDDYTQTSGGSILIDIAGTTAVTQYGQLIVGGQAALNGHVGVSLQGGFVPAPGDSFTMITAGALSGTFASQSLPPQISACASLDYGPSAVTLRCINVSGVEPEPPIPGSGASISMAAPVPNPARGPLTLVLDAAQDVGGNALKIYDIAGHLVRHIEIGPVRKGSTTLRWDGQDDRGRAVMAGMYFLRLESNGKSVGSSRVMLIR